MTTITIAGKPFEVEARYSEGHVLNANEANTLNQTFFENIRNNFAAKAKDNGTQDDLNAYVSTYQFGVRTGGGGGSRDPVEVEAMNMARDSVKDAIKKAGKNISDYSAKSISEIAAKLLDRDASFRELAKKRVEELQNSASSAVDDDLLSGLEPAAPAEQETPDADAPVSGRKPKASAA